MATDVGSARVEIVGDVSKFAAQVRSDLNRILNGLRVDPVEVVGEFDRVEREARDAANDMEREFERSGEQAEDALGEVGDKGEREFDRIEREARGAGRGMSRALKGALAGIAAAFATVQVGRFFTHAVEQAANLEESINAVEVVLGDAAGSFLTFGEDAAGSLGITQAALNQAIVPIGSLLSNAGLSGEELSGSLQDLSTRATDVASVFNADVNTVLDAFGAALRGETEPIRQFGVNLNQAAIDAKAVELGLADANGEVDQSARLQAALALAMEQTSSAAGDFQNTADSLPNLMRTFKASLDEAAAGVGEALLPGLIELVPAITALIGPLGSAFGAIGEVLGSLAAQLAPVVEIIGESLARGIRFLLPAVEPVGEAFLAIVDALAPLLPVLGQLLGTVLPPLANVLGLVADALAPVIELIAEHMAAALDRLSPLFPPLVEILGEVAGVIGDVLVAVLPILSDLILTLFDAISPLIPTVLELVKALLPLLDPIVELIEALLPPLVTLMTTLLVPILALLDPILKLATILIDLLVSGAITPLIETLTTALVPILEVLAQVLLLTLVPAIEFLSAIMEGDFAGAFENAGGHIGFFRDLVLTVFNFVRNLIVDRIASIVATANRIREFAARVRQFFGEARDAVVDRINAMIDLVGGFPRRILDAVGNLGNLLKNAGRQIIDGLIDGIRSGFDQVRDTLGNLTDLLPNWKGPAHVDREILRQAGRQVMEGFQTGIDDQRGSIERQLRGITDDLGSFTGTVRGGDGAGMAGPGGRGPVTVENLNLTALDNHFSLDEVKRSLERTGVM